MTRLHTFAVIAALAFSVSAHADNQHLNVQSLYLACKDSNGPTAMLCSGYVGGIGEMMHALGTQIPDDPKLRIFGICGTMSHGAMVQAFVNWADKHPERWADVGVLGVMSALIETWPCPAFKD